MISACGIAKLAKVNVDGLKKMPVKTKTKEKLSVSLTEAINKNALVNNNKDKNYSVHHLGINGHGDVWLKQYTDGSKKGQISVYEPLENNSYQKTTFLAQVEKTYKDKNTSKIKNFISSNAESANYKSKDGEYTLTKKTNEGKTQIIKTYNSGTKQGQQRIYNIDENNKIVTKEYKNHPSANDANPDLFQNNSLKSPAVEQTESNIKSTDNNSVDPELNTTTDEAAAQSESNKTYGLQWVIGAGAGGLTGGYLLGRSGKRVLK